MTTITQRLKMKIASGKWVSKTVDIATTDGFEKVQALQQGNIAVHKALKGSKWVITHSPSGLAIAKDLSNKSIAKRLADVLIVNFPEMLKADKKQMEQLAKRKGREIQQLIITMRKELSTRKPSKKQLEDKESNKTYFEGLPLKNYKKKLDVFHSLQEDLGFGNVSDLNSLYRQVTNVKDQTTAKLMLQCIGSLRDIIRGIESGRKGAYNSKHRKFVEKLIKNHNLDVSMLKKMGIDVDKVSLKEKVYLVNFNKEMKAKGHTIGEGEGEKVKAVSAVEAKNKVGDKHGFNPFYLEAKEV